MSLDDIAVVTYTTSKYSDVWPIHFRQLTKHLGGIKSYVLSDHGSKEKFDFSRHRLIEHDDSSPYWIQFIDGLDQIPHEKVIYLQDDFFLYEDVDHGMLAKVRDFLDERSEFAFVRLIRCGYSTPLDKHVRDFFFEIDQATPDIFAMQATMWKKNKMRALYAHVASQKWLEGEHWNVGCRQQNVRGVFTWCGEPKRGKFHHDSKVWPYVCTAICKGKWALDEYPDVMDRLLSEYGVDPNVRGVRVR